MAKEYGVTYTSSRYPHKRKTEDFDDEGAALRAFCLALPKHGDVTLRHPTRKLAEAQYSKAGAALIRTQDGDGYWAVELLRPTATNFYREHILVHRDRKHVATAFMWMFSSLCATERSMLARPGGKG